MGLLSNPVIYSRYQDFIGALEMRKRLVNEFIKPFPGAKIIDIGCGPGTMLGNLPDDIQYTGFDLESKYIEYAKQQYGDRGEFICEGIDEFVNNTPNHFDIVTSIGLLHHLNDKQANKVFCIAKEALVPGGRIITCDPAFVKNQNRITKFIVSLDRGKYVRTPEGYLGTANTVFSDVVSHVVTDMLRIPFTSFVMSCAKEQ